MPERLRIVLVEDDRDLAEVPVAPAELAAVARKAWRRAHA